jgi:hypothetical protein
MSVSSSNEYAKDLINSIKKDHASPDFKSKKTVLVSYQIKNAEHAIPLLYGLVSHEAKEHEFLYPRQSCSKVEGISIIRSTDGKYPLLRVGVVLTETTQISKGVPLKNVFNGDDVAKIFNNPIKYFTAKSLDKKIDAARCAFIG